MAVWIVTFRRNNFIIISFQFARTRRLIKSAFGGHTEDNAPIQQSPQTIAGRPVALAKFNKYKRITSLLCDYPGWQKPRLWTMTFRLHVTNNVRGLGQLAFGSLISSVGSIASNRKFSLKTGFLEVILRFSYILAFLSTTSLHTDEKNGFAPHLLWADMF